MGEEPKACAGDGQARACGRPAALLTCRTVILRPFLLSIVLAAALGGSAADAAPPETLPPSALHPGQHAVVLTVFAGDSVETFDADIVGVLSPGRAQGDIILARATSPRVVACGIAAGMSGSPVYVDGRLVGALALGWPFSKEPIFGITPIGEMLKVLDQPESPGVDGSSGPGGVGAVPRATWRGLSWAGDTLDAAPAPAVPGALPRALPLPLAAGGLADGALAFARPLFEPAGFLVTPGGRVPAAEAKAPVIGPGSAIAVDIMRGDVNMSAIGTVTWCDGDRLLLFGHPFFQAGEVRLPLSSARIVTVLASLYDSFKLGMAATPVGVATQDRRPAVAGRLGGTAHLMPFTVRVESAAGAAKTYTFACVEDRTLLPQLVATASMNSLLESGGSGGLQTVDATLEVWKNGRSFSIVDRHAGEAPFNDAAAGIAGPLRWLMGSSFASWRPDSLRIAFGVQPGRDEWTLRSLALAAAAVRPGSRARVRAEVERWRGERRVLEFDLDVPANLPPGRYSLWAGGGDEFDRLGATRQPGRYRPTSFEDGVRRLVALKPSTALYAALWARGASVTADGEDYADLPLSTLALLAPPQSVNARVRRGDWLVLSEARTPWDGVLRGEAALDLVVDDKAP